MRKASNTSRVVWAILVGGAFLSITLMQLTSAAAKPPDGKGGGKGGGGGGSAPPAVEDLAVIVDPASHNTITLVWTAPGDSSFTAVAYDIRYLIGEPVTDANWDAAWVTYSDRDLEPVPQPGGSLETVTIQHLAGNQVYYFAMRVIGSKGKVSALSNNGESVLAMTASAPVGAWDLELLAQASISDHADFAFDPADGQPSVIYSDLGSNEMRFAHFNSTLSIWEPELVVPNAGLASVLLEYDAMNRATIVFYGVGIEGIWYGVRDSGEWFLQQITSSRINGAVLDLTHDASGNPHVLFDLLVTTGKGKSRTRSSQLTFAIRDGSGWRTELIDTSDRFLMATMTLDADGNALVAYSRPIVDAGPFTFRLARRLGSQNWTIETIQDFVDEKPAQMSMAIDPGTGSPLIAFRLSMTFSPDDPLQVARFVNEAWQIELVDPFALNINNPKLRFDPTGAAVIVYRNSGSVIGDMSTVLLARDNGTSWDIEVVAEYDASLVGLRAPRLRFDTFSGNATILFVVNHNGSSSIPNIDELFMTWRVGN